ncbi:MAG TPA: DUF4199 domain-containing protein [Puia sp.]|nr:DUF4199 domain-containing protein [Puia sp.]
MAQRKKIPLLVLFGSLAALGMILFTLGAYKGGTETFLGPMVFLMYLIPVACGIIAALTERRRRSGRLEFQTALRLIFGIMVVAMAVQTLFTWLLVHVFDPGFGRALAPVVLAKMEAAWRRFGMPEADIQKNIAAARAEDAFAFGSMLFGLARDYLLGFLVSLILAVTIKRKNPSGETHK